MPTEGGRGDSGGRLLLIDKNVLLILVASSILLISVSDSITLSRGFFEELPASCLMAFHHEAASSQFFTFLSKKELWRRLFNLLTLFLNNLNVSGSLSIACCLSWIKDLNSEVIQGLSFGCYLLFRNGKKRSIA